MDLGLSVCAQVLHHPVRVALDDVDVGLFMGTQVVTPTLARGGQSPDRDTSPAFWILSPQVAARFGTDDEESALAMEDVCAWGVLVRETMVHQQESNLEGGEGRAGH